MRPYCPVCDRCFADVRALEQHLQMSPFHNYCPICDIDFGSWRALREHFVQSRKHDYCQYCDEHFEDKIDREDHMEEIHDYCKPCGRIFRNEVGLHEHRRQVHRDLYCVQCRRIFQSSNGLNKHLNSPIHRPDTFTCSKRDCKQSFTSKSELALHLESNTCKSDMNSQSVVDNAHDRNNVIAEPARPLTGTTGLSTIATRAAWNGHAYECYFCHREFRSLHALNQHLNSPRHQDRIYRCPQGACGTEFATLGELCQHIENDNCGVVKFRGVQDVMDSCISAMRRLEL